jgi:cardiolipin synthase
MMHAKLIMADGRWAMVGSANLDNRSLHLSFEAGCVLHSPALVAELEEQFRHDVEDSVRLDPDAFAARGFACRLFSPLLRAPSDHPWCGRPGCTFPGFAFFSARFAALGG